MAQTTKPPAPGGVAHGTFQPYVPATQSPAEFTIKAILLGIFFGLLFGASTVYLGLRAGLTVSASIPIAVLAISVLKKLGGSTILENNIVQTIGSAGESVAAGVVFTIPALIFLTPDGPGYFNYLQITILAFAGGILGVLMMVPLRRALIVKEHGVLPYPEGTACADVLVAGETGGTMAKLVFQGLGIGVLWKGVSWIVQIFRTEIGYSMGRTSFFPNATLNVDISPEYMGVGYVIGPQIAGVMFAGGVLSWLVLLPLLTYVGNLLAVPLPPGTELIANMSAGQIWRGYIRYIGAGAVLAAGLITLARTIPTIVASFRDSMKDVGGAAGGRIRTERDMPMTIVLAGTALLAIFLAVMPKMPTQGNVLVSILVVVFGFFFVTVSSLNGRHVILLEVQDTSESAPGPSVVAAVDQVVVWIDNQEIVASITSIGALAPCVDLHLKDFVGTAAEIRGVAWDPPIDPTAPQQPPNDNFGSYSLSFQKDGGAGGGIPALTPTTRVPTVWPGPLAPGVDGSLAMWDIVNALDASSPTPTPGIPAAAKLARNERCAYVIALSVQDTTHVGDSGSHHTDFALYAINIINDVP